MLLEPAVSFLPALTQTKHKESGCMSGESVKEHWSEQRVTSQPHREAAAVQLQWALVLDPSTLINQRCCWYSAVDAISGLVSFTHARTHAHTHTYTHAHIHTRTHTHSLPPTLATSSSSSNTFSPPSLLCSKEKQKQKRPHTKPSSFPSSLFSPFPSWTHRKALNQQQAKQRKSDFRWMLAHMLPQVPNG